MKRTWQQGVNAYHAGVSVEEAKADIENNIEWVMGWFSAQSEALDKKYSDYSAILTKYENSLDKWEKHIDELQKENRLLKQQLQEALSVQVVH